MGAKQGVGRPSKKVLRVEVRLNMEDTVMQAFVREAEQRGITVQEHILDMIKARILAVPQRQEPEQQQSKDSASASADVWM